MDNKDLVNLAVQASKNSYSPYSNFEVGAALLCENGEVFLGCNVENSAYGDSICAERTAILKAVSEGNRTFKKIAIVGRHKGQKIKDHCFPCGTCRQVMNEFADENFEIVVAKDVNGNLEVKSMRLIDLLPEGFKL